MIKASKRLEFTFERTIPAPAGKVFDAWLNPKVPGNPWQMADKLILDPRVDGFFYWRFDGIPHYGRFTKVERPGRIQSTWVSPNTLGEESLVTVTFRKQGEGTLMTLVHSNLPDTAVGRSHQRGWNYFLGRFPDYFSRR